MINLLWKIAVSEEEMWSVLHIAHFLTGMGKCDAYYNSNEISVKIYHISRLCCIFFQSARKKSQCI